MGNRAYIRGKNHKCGVYLHWNGGRDSVGAFLKYCELRGFEGFECDYGIARFCQVVGNFFGGGNSIGIEDEIDDDCACYADNGIYIVEGWKIVDRIFDGVEQNNYDLNEMLIDIDNCQPVKEQMGAFLLAKEKPVTEIKVGDKVFISDWAGKYEMCNVIGVGIDEYVNGTNVKGKLYTDRFEGCQIVHNINNYLLKETYRVVE